MKCFCNTTLTIVFAVATSAIAAACTPPGTIPGDADQNGVVEFADFLALSRNYGTQSGATWAQGDFDCDGNVDFGDFLAAC